jgi:hypothetical protein
VDGGALGQVFLQVTKSLLYAFFALTPLAIFTPLIKLRPLIFGVSVFGRFIFIYLFFVSYGNDFDLRPLSQEYN